MRLPVLAAATLATVALASACGSSNGGLIPTDTAGSLTTDLTNIQAGVVAGDCAVTNAAIESARIDFENLPAAINSQLRSQLIQGFNTLVLSAELKCQANAGGPTGPTGSTSSTSTSSTTSSSTSTSTSSTTTTSSAATTTSSSAASTSATTTGPSCTPITTPNGGTVCVGATGDTSNNGIGGGGGIGGPGT